MVSRVILHITEVFANRYKTGPSTSRIPTEFPPLLFRLEYARSVIAKFVKNTIVIVITAWIRLVVSNTIDDSLLNPSSYMYPSSRCNNGTVGRSMYS